MILALSSAAAPRATLSELLHGCVRRGLQGVHLIEGHAHGVSLESSDSALLDVRAEIEDHGLALTSLHAVSRRAVTPERAAAVTQIARVPLVMALDETPNDWTDAFQHAGGLHVAGLSLDATRGNVMDAARAWPNRELPSHITLHGAGPEAARYEGHGIGSLMTRLSLDAWQGVLVLAPTGKAVLPVWKAWLEHGRSWGCGSHKSDPSLVTIG
jgi:hypothetical protein